MPRKRPTSDAGDRSARPPEGSKRVLADGRQQLLVYLPPEMIRALKLTAVERDSSVSHLVEQAISLWRRSEGGKG
jgi:hypothetical protein